MLEDKKINENNPLLSSEEAGKYLLELKDVWSVGNKELYGVFKFNDFITAMDFVNRVAFLSETEQHHPEINISYNVVKIILTSHSAGGITENDFILAKKIDKI